HMGMTPAQSPSISKNSGPSFARSRGSGWQWSNCPAGANSATSRRIVAMGDTDQPRQRALRILLIEDNPGDARLTSELLREVASVHADLVHADNLTPGIALLADWAWPGG